MCETCSVVAMLIHTCRVRIVSLSEEVRGQVVHVYGDALMLVWYVCLAFSAFCQIQSGII